jgi:hypothetical protein
MRDRKAVNPIQVISHLPVRPARIKPGEDLVLKRQ